MAKRPGTVSPTAIQDFGVEDLNSSADTSIMDHSADGTANRSGADPVPDHLSLEEILSLYSQPINEEQAWAVCYQCCRSLQSRHRRTTSKTPAAQQGSVIVDHHHKHDAIRKIEGPEDVRIRRDGTLVVHHQHDTDKYRAANTSLQVIESLGIMIYKALDYGLKESEERELSPPLERLIDLMTNTTAETECDDPCPDEGYEATEEEEDEGDEGPAAIVPGTAVASVRSYRDIMAICSSHLPSPSDAPSHYQAVCRALYAETKELRTFLDKIRSAKENLRMMEVHTRGDPVQDLDELQNADWARFWVQVMRDLRDGVKLKKVQERQYNPLPIEYQLTPYEMLMDDIRSKRYKLRKVTVNGGIPPRLKKSAHEVILDFIRSRPPLNPASARKLKPHPPRPASLHERLLEGIKSERKLRPVSPDTLRRHRLGAGKSISTPQDLFRGSDTPDAPRKLAGSTQSLGNAALQGGAHPLTQRKRLLKAPTLAELDSSDSDEDATQSSSSANTSMVEETSPESVMSRKGRPNFLPISSTPERVERHAHQRRHSIEKEAPTSVRPFVPASRQSSKSLLQQAEPTNKVDVVSSDQGGEEFCYPVECLALTVEEVMHIRQVLVKAELEKFQQYKDIYTALKKGKLCFSCRAKKFSLFTWSYICQFCKRPVCSQCSKKMRLPSKPYSSLPIYSMGPSAMSKYEDATPSASAQADKTPFGSAHNRQSLRRTVSKMSRHSGGAEGQSQDQSPELPKELTEDWATMEVCVDCKKFITEIISSSKRSLSVATKRARLNRNRKTQSFYLASSSSSSSINFRPSERTINEV